MGETVLFYVFSALAIVTSVLVIGQRSPMHSVLLLVGSFAMISGLYVLLDAPFVAVTQIIVYAGAIMVLFLFVVMLLNVPREDPVNESVPVLEASGARVLGALLAVAMVVELVWALSETGRRVVSAPGDRAAAWSVAEIGRLLFRNYGFAFEAT